MNYQNIEQYVKKNLDESKDLIDRILKDEMFTKNIMEVAILCCTSIENKGKIIFAGNGGSAADAQHFSAELMIRFQENRKSIPSIALNTDTSIITACANDFGFEDIFTRQLEGLANQNDIFIAISTSGNSQNILNALQFAKSKEIKSVLLTGSSNLDIKNFCDYIIRIPSKSTARIQELHSLCGHLICGIIENYFLEN